MANGANHTLLLLGGAQHQCPAIEAARRLGYKTILCDYLADNPGQKIADTYYPVDSTDYAEVIKIARKERITGIIAYGSDAALPCAGRVAQELGLPTNSIESIEILSNKDQFHPYLQAHGFLAPNSVSFFAGTPPAELCSLMRDLSLPIVVKPTDSSGSKGVKVLKHLSESKLLEAISGAAFYSRNKILVAEEFIQYGFPHLIGGDIFINNGQVQFWGLMSCLRDSQASSLVPVGKAYPSGLDAESEVHLKQEIQRLVDTLDLHFGEMNIEAIISPEGNPYILELGGRAGGNLIPLQLSDISGIDLVEASVRLAVGEECDDLHFDGGAQVVATYVLHALRDGLYDGVRYDAEIMPYIYREYIYVKPGDRVRRLTNSSESIGHIFLRFSDEDEMWSLLARIGDLVQVVVR